VPPGEPAAAAAALTALLRDAPLRARIGGAARRFVEARYSIESVLDRQVAIYRSLIAAQEGHARRSS
jgi:glycosyltransferase involved in cell wall biosynthesis